MEQFTYQTTDTVYLYRSSVIDMRHVF